MSSDRVSITRTAAIVYIVNQYPAVTHTFIRREILALEQHGLRIVRVAARAGLSLIDPADLSEKARTTYLLSGWRGWFDLGLSVLAVRSLRAIGALGLTLRLMHRSDRSPALHLLYFAEACRLARIVRRSGSRHIHAHFGTNPAELALLASYIAGASFSFTVHGYDEYDKPEFLGLAIKIRYARFVACVSFYGRSQLLRWCDWPDREKIKIIRCGIGSDQLNLGARAASRATVPRLLCVGRLCREKAQDVLVRAAWRLASTGVRFEVVLVGDGETRAELDRMIEDFQLSNVVRLTGWLTGARVRDEMLRARALVVPSFAENLPVVIIEAMALGRPVIATCIAGVPELVVPKETGWLIPASSVEALAQAMEGCLIASDADLEAMGERGRQRVAVQHDIGRETAKLAALFAEGSQGLN
jgi:colanic acid/amylovoran biosynthesis glycosyltransferase